MEWNQSDVLALAMEKCSTCGGYGMRPSRTGQQTACNCVLRSIFRACFQRFQNCMLRKDSIGRPHLEHTASPHGKLSWARKNEEFIADFLLVTKRTLSEAEYKIFKYHYLLGADWKPCCRKLKMEKGVSHRLDVVAGTQKIGLRKNQRRRQLARSNQLLRAITIGQHLIEERIGTRSARRAAADPVSKSGSRLAIFAPVSLNPATDCNCDASENDHCRKQR